MFQACEYPTIDLAISQAYDSLVHALGEQPSTAITWAFLQYESLSKIIRRVDTPGINRQEKPLMEEGDTEYKILAEHNLPGKVCEAVFGAGATNAWLKTIDSCTEDQFTPSERYQEVISHPIQDYLKAVRIDAYRFYLVVPEEVKLYGEALGIYREDWKNKSSERKSLILPVIDQIRKYAWTDLIREN